METKTTSYYLCLIHPPTPTNKSPRWKYSDELFDWFYSKVRFVGHSDFLFKLAHIDLEKTRNDNSQNGIRIWYKNGEYDKLDEVYLLMDLDHDEHSKINDLSFAGSHPTIDNVIEAFYQLDSYKTMINTINKGRKTP